MRVMLVTFLLVLFLGGCGKKEDNSAIPTPTPVSQLSSINISMDNTVIIKGLSDEQYGCKVENNIIYLYPSSDTSMYITVTPLLASDNNLLTAWKNSIESSSDIYQSENKWFYFTDSNNNFYGQFKHKGYALVAKGQYIDVYKVISMLDKLVIL